MDNYDFEKIPLWSNKNPSFDVLVDDVVEAIITMLVANEKEGV